MPSAGMRGSESWSAVRVSMLHPPEAALAKCVDEGILNFDDAAVLRIPPFAEFGTPMLLRHGVWLRTPGREGFSPPRGVSGAHYASVLGSRESP